MVQSQAALDRTFAALSDPTRRAILLRLGGGTGASIGSLSEHFEMTLTGFQKHVRILEEAGLVTTEKVGRVRHCKLGPKRLEDVAKWMATYRTMLEQRLDNLEDFLERTKGTP
ncbi:ArsR family transcriptional regulator [Corallococcus sp. AB011P]|uniref:ArsR/SmtB family transcription factor n=1 Tax=unclassified Corallococcus TaxID=2685029 RepID=UPI000EA32BFE|nr:MULTISPECIES: metalloregulator ArsR/SmtB family transcription factor [unclassified Corallococcus]RKG56546.1 ArsR family transcriptional regulator [Corallococcus sp. AB011P]RKH89403.1 ArsR family transcriptional regulator [Corallococcus sp. AB045]